MSILTDTRNTPEAWTGRAGAPSSWEAAGWSEIGQTQRFMAVRKYLDIRSGESLLDFGAGTGRFAAFLPFGVQYTALDWSEGMRDRIAQDNPGARVVSEVPDEFFDHAIAVGAFNLRDNWSKEQTWDTLHDLFCHTKRSLIVSLYRGDDERCLSYGPREVLDFALRYSGFHDALTLDGSHLPNDVLLVLRG